MKRLSLAIASLCVLMTFASCNKEQELVTALKVEVDPATLTFEYVEGATEPATQTVSLVATRDWTATVTGEGVSVSPESGKASNDPQTITVTADNNSGKTKTALITFAAGNKEATVTVTVNGALGNLISIEDVYNSVDGSTVETSGLVVGVNAKEFVISDETGYLLVYRESADNAGAEIGDQVKVSGTIGKYGDMPQLIEPVTIETIATDQTVTYPENPTVITAENISTFDIKKVSYIQMTGDYTASGQYHNLVIEGTTVQGSFAYPIDGSLEEYVGHNITVTGFFAGGNNPSYRNILVVSVKDNGVTEVKPVSVQGVIDAEKGSLVKTSGKVMAICEQGYIVADETAAIFVYKGSGWECNLKIGNTVSVSGTRDEYNSGKQIKSSTEEVTDASETAPDYGTPVDLTEGSAFASYQFTKSEYVKYKGVLSSNRYVTVDGSAVQGSFYYVTGDYSAMNGKTVTVTGYIVQCYKGSNGNPDSWNTVVVSVEAEPYISAESKTVSASETSTTVEVSSNVDWTVECDADWISDYTKSGSGNGTITISFNANDSEERTAVFTLSGEGVEKQFSVIQSASGVTSSTYTFVAESKLISGNGDVTLGNLVWTVDTDAGYFGVDTNSSDKGMQIGSSGKPATYIDLRTTGITGSIKSIKINASGASGIAGNLSVTVGGNAFGDTQTLSSSATEYTFTGSASGEIVIKYSQTSSKAMYLKSIEIVYEN